MADSTKAKQAPALLIRVEQVKYRKAGPGKSPLGSLCVYEDRVQWTSDPDPADQLLVPFSKLKGQRISPPNKPKVQLQLCMLNDDQATFVFMNSAHDQQQLLADRDLVKETLQQALLQHRQLVNQMAQQAAKGGSARERQSKEQLLAQNAHLFDLYKHLVASKLISPQDFWSFHYKTDDKNKSDSSGEQRVGVSGGFLSSIVQSEGVNGIRLNLTTEIIQSIFRTYPAVERKHLELVPHEMNEQEFWSRFFQSHYFHRERNPEAPSTSKAAPARAATDADPFADCVQMDEKDMRELITKGQRSLKRHRDFSYINEDLGILSDMRSAQISLRGSSMAKRLLVRRCNYHSERVLETAAESDALQDNQIAAENGENVASTKNGIDDTNEQHQQQQSQAVAGAEEEDVGLELESFELADLDRPQDEYTPLAAYNPPKMSVQRPPPEEVKRAHQALLEAIESSGSVLEEKNQIDFFDLLTSHHLDDEDEERDREEAQVTAAVTFQRLNKADVEQIRTVHACMAELLRHFWSCFPPRTPELEQKLFRMSETLDKFERTQLAECERQFGSIYVQQCRDQLGMARRRLQAFQQAATKRKP